MVSLPHSYSMQGAQWAVPIKIILDLQMDLPRLDNATYPRLHSVGIREVEPVTNNCVKERAIAKALC